MDDVIKKLKKNGRAGELSDDMEEAAAEALYEAAEQSWDAQPGVESAMVWQLLAVHALKRVHDMTRVSPDKLMPVVEAMLTAELEG